MEKLDDNYDISVDDMNSIGEPMNGWEVYTGSFMNKAGHNVDMKYLSNLNKSIFSMKDGLFILEVETDNVEYFCSTDINDLL
jgi:hypothetical protein